MTPIPRRGALAVLPLLLPSVALAAEIRAGDLVLTDGWTRAAGANGVGAGYLTIRNTGTVPDRLLNATAGIARSVELHTHVRDGEVMRMRQVTEIPIAPGETVTFQPGGLHVMLIGLTEALRQGASVPLTLRFERAGVVELPLAVQAAGARGPGGH